MDSFSFDIDKCKKLREFKDDDQAYFERELQNNPFSVNTWKNYILSKIDGSEAEEVNLIAERAVKQIPGSYKLWMLHLRNLVYQCEDRCIKDPQFSSVNDAFERALTFFHKMPVVWISYINFLIKQKLITKTRQTFDRALHALPITQHEFVWPIYLEFVKQKSIPAETAVRALRRHTMLFPEYLEERVRFLKTVHRLDSAALLLVQIVNNDEFTSKLKKSKEKLWDELCSLMCKNPKTVTSLDVDSIIRSAIKKYQVETGKLWTSLADYYLRVLQFEKTRDVYEEGLRTVSSVRDFEFIFNTYCQFFELLIRSKFEGENESSVNAENSAENKSDFDIESDDIDLLMARYEDLLERRPVMVNSVLLRQNPHNVSYWLRRADIFVNRGQNIKVLETYAMAIKTLDPKKCTGSPHLLWIKLAKFYEERSKDLVNVRKTFEKAVLYPFRKVDQLATVWCEWAETEIRHKNFKKAFEVIRRATTIPYKKDAYEVRNFDENTKAQDRVFRSTKLWAFYADLEEAFGTVETVSAVYEAMIDLKIATVPIILNYAKYLETKKYFERSFAAFEKGVALFKYPHVVPIWNTYLQKFVERNKDSKIERTRDLFDHALSTIPPGKSKGIYLLYGQFEEEFGTPKNAIAVYDRLCEVMEGKDKFDMFLVYLSKASDMFGAIKTREIYEKAIKTLPDAFLPPICIRFAELEIRLGEVDRARAIFQYGAKFADTRVFLEFWEKFEKFEADFGNIETFADMNRVKRSVAASFINFIVPSAEELRMRETARKGEAKRDSASRMEVE